MMVLKAIQRISFLLAIACLLSSLYDFVVPFLQENATPEPFEISTVKYFGGFLQIAETEYIYYGVAIALKPTGVVFLVLALYFMPAGISSPGLVSTRLFHRKSWPFLLSQTIGAFTQLGRLINAYLYGAKQYSLQQDNLSLEPNYVALGVATGTGFLSVLIYMLYMYLYMYNIAEKHENVCMAIDGHNSTKMFESPGKKKFATGTKGVHLIEVIPSIPQSLETIVSFI